MNDIDVARKLLYNMDYYKIYKELCAKVDTKYITFEQFLLFGDNFINYLEDPEEIKREYFNYHEYQNPKEYESFEVFCNSFKLFMYDDKLIDEERKCENCRFYNFNESTIGYNIPPCGFDAGSILENPCPGHMFDLDKGEVLIKTLRKNLKSNKDSLLNK